MTYVISLAYTLELQDEVSFVAMYPIFPPKENCLIPRLFPQSTLLASTPNFLSRSCTIILLTPASNTSSSTLTIYSGAMRKQRKRLLSNCCNNLLSGEHELRGTCIILACKPENTSYGGGGSKCHGRAEQETYAW